MKQVLLVLTFSILATGCREANPVAADSAIRRIENCVCYRSVEGQKLQPWQLAWKNPEKLRQQFSHCVCNVHIDLQSVKDPSRYVVPGTQVR